ncbi:hypothetical protein WJX84_002810 [Apatococcus fuscideae]|uniref:RING-type domain-containing protein n=1 Tax=Apatococcus fuscideae TaxID=2026836 RepID=A0AAW1T581_9CHLO
MHAQADCSKVLAGLTEALNLASQACTALADSSRLAGSWLAHADLQSTALGDLQQVRNCMRQAKAALQGLSAAKARSATVPSEAGSHATGTHKQRASADIMQSPEEQAAIAVPLESSPPPPHQPASRTSIKSPIVARHAAGPPLVSKSCVSVKQQPPDHPGGIQLTIHEGLGRSAGDLNVPPVEVPTLPVPPQASSQGHSEAPPPVLSVPGIATLDPGPPLASSQESTTVPNPVLLALFTPPHVAPGKQVSSKQGASITQIDSSADMAAMLARKYDRPDIIESHSRAKPKKPRKPAGRKDASPAIQPEDVPPSLAETKELNEKLRKLARDAAAVGPEFKAQPGAQQLLDKIASKAAAFGQGIHDQNEASTPRSDLEAQGTVDNPAASDPSAGAEPAVEHSAAATIPSADVPPGLPGEKRCQEAEAQLSAAVRLAGEDFSEPRMLGVKQALVALTQAVDGDAIQQLRVYEPVCTLLMNGHATGEHPAAAQAPAADVPQGQPHDAPKTGASTLTEGQRVSRDKRLWEAEAKLEAVLQLTGQEFSEPLLQGLKDALREMTQHDTVGQQLNAALRMGERLVDRVPPDASAEPAETASEISNYLDDTVSELGSIQAPEATSQCPLVTQEAMQARAAAVFAAVNARWPHCVVSWELDMGPGRKSNAWASSYMELAHFPVEIMPQFALTALVSCLEQQEKDEAKRQLEPERRRLLPLDHPMAGKTQAMAVSGPATIFFIIQPEPPQEPPLGGFCRGRLEALLPDGSVDESMVFMREKMASLRDHVAAAKVAIDKRDGRQQCGQAAGPGSAAPVIDIQELERAQQQLLAKSKSSKREQREKSEALRARELREERNRQAWAKVGKEPPPPKAPKPATPADSPAASPARNLPPADPSEGIKRPLPTYASSNAGKPTADVAAGAKKQPQPKSAAAGQAAPSAAKGEPDGVAMTQASLAEPAADTSDLAPQPLKLLSSSEACALEKVRKGISEDVSTGSTTEVDPDEAESGSESEDDHDDADKMLETMGDALGLISQASAALSTSIRQAASWLGHANSQSAPPAKLMQVRERMRMSKEALQKLGPIAAAIAPAAAIVKPAAAMKPLEDDDDACIICLDQLSTVVFSPCNHRVTCGACAKLVLKAKQPCPLCRGPVVSVRR